MPSSETLESAGGRSKIKIPRLLLLAVAGVIVIAAIGGVFLSRWLTWQRFSSEKYRIESVVESWRTTPAGADPDQWEYAWQTVYNAVGNVCFTPDHVSGEEMVRLRHDVEQRGQQPPTLETLEWLWQRLGQTGSHGKDYITRMRPLWDEARLANAGGEDSSAEVDVSQAKK